jgi:predicted amidohydrolase YtcJ
MRSFFLLLTLVLSASALGAEDPADTLIVNGRLPTVANATAIAIRGERIAAVGTDAVVRALAGPNTKVIDARGRSVVPGFNDDHLHITLGMPALSVPAARLASDLPALQEMVRKEAKGHPEREWVELDGFTLNQVPGRQPTRQMLDAAVKDRPVVIWALDRHSAWANTRALQLSKITRETPNPAGGIIERDKNGDATGWLKEPTAVILVRQTLPKLSQEERLRRLTAVIREAHRNGVTSITEGLGYVEDFALIDDLRKAGRLNIRITYSLGFRPNMGDEDIERFQTIWRTHPETPEFKTGLIKMAVDGVPSSGTAFLLRPLPMQKERGEPLFEPKRFKDLIRRFDAAGWQIMLHAIGDGAVRLALDAYEEAIAVNPVPGRGRRHRIEHASFVDPADVPRFAKLGIIASYQTGGFQPPGPPTVQPDLVLVPQDGARWNAIRALGGRVAWGSDWPVGPIDPVSRIYGVVNNRRADLRMDVKDVLNAYTRDAAYASFDDAKVGTLEVGKFADIVLLSRDMIAQPPEKASDLSVDMTIFAGRVVYDHAAGP